MRRLTRVRTADEADLTILALASEKLKFAVEVGMALDVALQDAFERGMENEWFRLIDVTTNLPSAPGRLMRVFRLTRTGVDRLTQLTNQYMEGVGHG